MSAASARVKRKIIHIDEEKCDGCGLCAEACHEGAIRVIEGKARLISESYCDGLGDCIGPCPQGAITIEEREADPYDEEAVQKHLASQESEVGCTAAPQGGGCPGSAVQRFLREGATPSTDSEGTPSQLSTWPVQIKLLPVNAPCFKDADLLMAADCTAFAYADFHRHFIAGKVALVGCPKLDDADFYQAKLAEILRQNDIRSIEVAYMEVPCCGGLVRLVHSALMESGKKIPLKLTKIGIRGEVIDSVSF